MRQPLSPMRHQIQDDLFFCDFFDAVLKDDIASMEHPIFSLSTRSDRATRRYEHRNTLVEIIPSGIGLATIHDKDVLIYCISQLVAKMNLDKPIARRMRLNAYDFLAATNRQTSGEGYRSFADALTRLRGTTIRTNIKTGDQEETSVFGLIEEAVINRNTSSGRMQEIEIELSEWMYRSVISKNILTLHRDYFRLRKPMERRMYELARKHCGRQAEWWIGLDLLQKKCGSNSPLNVFRSKVKAICAHDAEYKHFPDYEVTLENNKVNFRTRSPALLAAAVSDRDKPYLDSDALQRAKAFVPGYDIYALYNEWGAHWRSKRKPRLKNAEAAFIGFCKKNAAINPL